MTFFEIVVVPLLIGFGIGIIGIPLISLAEWLGHKSVGGR